MPAPFNGALVSSCWPPWAPVLPPIGASVPRRPQVSPECFLPEMPGCSRAHPRRRSIPGRDAVPPAADLPSKWRSSPERQQPSKGLFLTILTYRMTCRQEPAPAWFSGPPWLLRALLVWDLMQRRVLLASAPRKGPGITHWDAHPTHLAISVLKGGDASPHLILDHVECYSRRSPESKEKGARSKSPQRQAEPSDEGSRAPFINLDFGYGR